MSQPVLFELPPERPAQEVDFKEGKPRLRTAERDQVICRSLSLNQMLPHDDEARTVWAFVEQCDLSELYASIRAVEGRPGRATNDPKVLLALWLFATLKGVGSAHELNRLCQRHLSYQWLCGEVSMNYHTLSDFRVDHAEILDRLLSQQVAALMHAGAVTLNRVAQDGMKVRASAGKSSFRRAATLDKCLKEAQEQVEKLKSEVTEDPAGGSRREKAARERAANERLARVTSAIAVCEQLQKKKEDRGRDALKTPARASTTDPDSSKMKTADGGFQPAYNVQFATDTGSQVIVGVDVIREGADGGQLGPMVQQIQQRTGKRPNDITADGGFNSKEDLQALNDPSQGHRVYLPVREAEKQLSKGQDPYAPRKGESPELTEWRTRMGTPEAKQIYKERAATAECVNALARQRGMHQFRVRGLSKVRTVAILFALAHNLRRWAVLCASTERQVAS